MVLTKYIKERYSDLEGAFSMPSIEVVNMKFANHLSRESIQQFNQLRRSSRNQKEKPKTKKQQEKLNQRDWEDIMGTRRDTYKRVGGAIRRR